MKNATFRQLRVFTEVAKHLSFARAAEVLHLTPPAVTMQVKELEGHVGLPLFERNGRQVALTTAGEYMLVYARKVIATLKDAEDAAARLQRLEVGTLTIGMVSTAKYFLPRLLAEFQHEHEGVEIRLAVGNREQLVKMLHGNEVDIAVMGRPPKELATRAEPFAAHPHVFVAPTDHPLLKVGHPTVDSLRPYGFILRERGSGTRAAMEKFLETSRMEPRVVMEMASNETIKQAVMAGMGISFLSLHTIGLELEHGLIATLDVEGTPIIRAWNVVHTLSKLLSPAAEAFRYFMLERAESHLAEKYGGLLKLPPAPSVG
ncbi:MAG: LysR family transcriptional regulator [Gammaproteobacteria bacterium]|uniref:LysR family transcriptional regulator n=1 Tax=Hydrogenophaga sp. TaxID=1904254 RepID=UPI0025BA460F|nr:LysR family transcriptional regulator [Hydrogenophaga sp.]MBU4184233.1 LysR family transcriptional regulator [Gammaproteobacteria bacterium]MBU4280773.1 LysR family transcriptional regulator [Gammaproteobacteria bacterium]MBU4324714.1 LysR family transcriptional regulator [Gammaproteobacteria bacterium]MBU4505880.1 LysR family transcriptional regulator [Gammaproteobacteria bacterium]MCG2656403.1 LysR substrate-binding domain-containing protein [Hydrogenophaga sp.]